MFQGKLKAITFSYDDGVTQDQRLIEIFNKYGLKCTFNLNSALLGKSNGLVRKDVTVAHVKPRICEIEKIYRGHEVAGHTLTHPDLTALSDADVIREVEEDRLALSEIVGYNVVGMAYPGGCFDDRVVRLIREQTGIRYARTVQANGAFDPQEELIAFHPTCHHSDSGWDNVFETALRFLRMETETPKILYIWGHAYEFDIDNSWGRMEDLCRLLANREDIFYGTNREVLLNE